VTITGAGLASSTRSWQSADIIGGALPTSLDGVRVRINGRQAYIYYISPSQLNVLAPADSATGVVRVEVFNQQATSSATYTANKQSFSPALFVSSQQGVQYAIAQDATTFELIAPPGFYGPSVATRTAKPGDRIALYATGLGPTSPAYPEGRVIETPATLANPIAATIAGVSARVEYAGIIGAGLYQMNVVVPTISAAAARSADIILSIRGERSPTGVRLAMSTE
jgi:uncharacterized protein (TIGR03437 family)